MTVEWLNVEKLKLTVENAFIFLKASHLFRKRMLHWLLMFSVFTQASLHKKKEKIDLKKCYNSLVLLIQPIWN